MHALLPKYVMAILVLSVASAKLLVPSIFADGCVLQTNAEYGARSRVYGRATPGVGVAVALAAANYTTTAGADGAWAITLDPLAEGVAVDFTISTDEGESVAIRGCVAGDVYLCGGQSNMCFSSESAFPPGPALADQAYPNIRLFAVAMLGADAPMPDFPPLTSTSQCSWNHDKSNASDPAYRCNAWMPSTPATNRFFSAVCLFTALEIAQRHTGARPIGLIYSAFGGTSASLWAPPAAYAQCPGAAAPHPPPGSLWNAMVAPLVQYSIRAVLFFQGEQDAASEAATPGWYSCRFTALIDYWRAAWGMGDFTFGFVQLGSIFNGGEAYGQLRFAQAREVPRPGGAVAGTAMAAAYDLGDREQAPAIGSVHFRNKTEVSRRLAFGVLHAHFGLQNASLLPPAVASVARVGAAAVAITIAVPDGSPPALTPGGQCGECCAARDVVQLSSDGGATFVNATVTLAGAVITATASVPAAFTHARFAAMDYVQCAVTAGNGLPLPAFLLPVAVAAGAVADGAARVAAADVWRGVAGSLTWRGREYSWTGATPPPPLGLNTWNAFHDNLSENLIIRVADALVSLGLRDLGYVFVNIDDGWQVSRMDNGTIVEDPAKFPSGMFALSAAVHARGLKFGLYTAQTALTCQGRPASYMHEAVDVARWCAWSLDYIKVDNCKGARWPSSNTSWVLMREAMAACAAPPRLSVEYCRDPAGLWCAALADLWRTTGDVQANFASVLSNLDGNNLMAPVSRPGRYNDPDLLVIGQQGVSLDEAQAQFAAWAVVCAPMLLSLDLTAPLPAGVLAILRNAEVLAVSQDAAQVQGLRVSAPAPAGAECWARPLAPAAPGAPPAVAALLLNRAPLGSAPANVSCSWEELGLPAGALAAARDLYAHADLGAFTGSLSLAVPPHASRLIKLVLQ